jgi:simple sugar transport system permease protein
MSGTVAEPVVGHSVVTAPRTWRTPVLLTVVALLTLVLFGILGRDETVRFIWSDPGDAIVLPATPASPRIIGIVGGLIALAAAVAAYFWAARRLKGRSSG